MNYVTRIETALNLFPEVTWDRFGGEIEGKMAIYGWIAREDGKSDYLQLIFDEGDIINFCTSSAKYSKQFGQRLGSDSHHDCRRVEHHFPNVKSVKLKNDGPTDVTSQVEFAAPDDELLPLTKCVCGERFYGWVAAISIYPEGAWECPKCGAKLIFKQSIKVLKL